jgi:hypothetical protein
VTDAPAAMWSGSAAIIRSIMSTREREFMTARAAHAAGFAPERGICRSRASWCRASSMARTYGEADVRAKRRRSALDAISSGDAGTCRGPGFMFWVFHVIRDYARTLVAGSRMADRVPAGSNFPSLRPCKCHCRSSSGTTTCCPPISLTMEQALADRLRVCRFSAPPCSTSPGIASNAEIDAAEADACSGGARPPDLRACGAPLHAMQCASLLRETMWSLVSELYLDAPGVDYEAYTAENLARLEASLDTVPAIMERLTGHDNFPDRAQIVVIGGGIIGCSTAYHLARDHKADVLLLEQGQADLRLDLARCRAGRPACAPRRRSPRCSSTRSISTSG